MDKHIFMVHNKIYNMHLQVNFHFVAPELNSRSLWHLKPWHFMLEEGKYDFLKTLL